MSANSGIGCYIHIPFCKSRCDYCAFLSCVADRDFRLRYVDALCKEIKKAGEAKNDYCIRTLYFGGGTPSVLSIVEIEKIVCALKDTYECGIIEQTIECNPSDVDDEYLNGLKKLGFDRVSMGVQTLRDDVLNSLNRRTSAGDVQKALEITGKYFDNVSVDLMLGLPGLSSADIKKSVEYLCDVSCVKHVSTYCLTCEEDTPLADKVNRSEVILPTDDQTAAQYEYVVKLLSAKGFDRYEVSNFARDGFVSKHNSSYWNRTEYFGFGAGASGFLNGVRYKNETDISRYISLAERGEDVKIEKNTLTDSDVIEEIIMLGLRTEQGVDLAALRDLGYDIKREKSDELEKLSPYLLIEDDRIAIKPRYMLVQNYIITELM